MRRTRFPVFTVKRDRLGDSTLCFRYSFVCDNKRVTCSDEGSTRQRYSRTRDADSLTHHAHSALRRNKSLNRCILRRSCAPDSFLHHNDSSFHYNHANTRHRDCTLRRDMATKRLESSGHRHIAPIFCRIMPSRRHDMERQRRNIEKEANNLLGEGHIPSFPGASGERAAPRESSHCRSVSSPGEKGECTDTGAKVYRHR
jgi:hypothetical protein